MKKTITLFTSSIFILLMLFAASASAAVTAIDTNAQNVAIRGYDTVAYFTEHKAVKGDADYSAQYKGATWYFANKDNMEKFQADPAKYAPQYGGYCAYAVSEQNRLVSADPNVWKIVDGKLYLNFNKAVQKIWWSNLKQDIVKGDQNYPQLIQQAAS